LLDTPGEIIAKKIQYRGSLLRPRDMFDIAAAAEKIGSDDIIEAIRQCDPENIQNTITMLNKTNLSFIQKENQKLVVRPHMKHVCENSLNVTMNILSRV